MSGRLLQEVCVELTIIVKVEKKTTDGIVQREKEHGDTFFFPTLKGIHNVSFPPVVSLTFRIRMANF